MKTAAGHPLLNTEINTRYSCQHRQINAAYNFSLTYTKKHHLAHVACLFDTKTRTSCPPKNIHTFIEFFLFFLFSWSCFFKCCLHFFLHFFSQICFGDVLAQLIYTLRFLFSLYFRSDFHCNRRKEYIDVMLTQAIKEKQIFTTTVQKRPSEILTKLHRTEMKNNNKLFWQKRNKRKSNNHNHRQQFFFFSLLLLPSFSLVERFLCRFLCILMTGRCFPFALLLPTHPTPKTPTTTPPPNCSQVIGACTSRSSVRNATPRSAGSHTSTSTCAFIRANVPSSAKCVWNVSRRSLR